MTTFVTTATVWEDSYSHHTAVLSISVVKMCHLHEIYVKNAKPDNLGLSLGLKNCWVSRVPRFGETRVYNPSSRCYYVQ